MKYLNLFVALIPCALSAQTLVGDGIKTLHSSAEIDCQKVAAEYRDRCYAEQHRLANWEVLEKNIELQEKIKRSYGQEKAQLQQELDNLQQTYADLFNRLHNSMGFTEKDHFILGKFYYQKGNQIRCLDKKNNKARGMISIYDAAIDLSDDQPHLVLIFKKEDSVVELHDYLDQNLAPAIQLVDRQNHIIPLSHGTLLTDDMRIRRLTPYRVRFDFSYQRTPVDIRCTY